MKDGIWAGYGLGLLFGAPGSIEVTWTMSALFLGYFLIKISGGKK